MVRWPWRKRRPVLTECRKIHVDDIPEGATLTTLDIMDGSEEAIKETIDGNFQLVTSAEIVDDYGLTVIRVTGVRR